MTPPTHQLIADSQLSQARHNIAYHRPVLQDTQDFMGEIRVAADAFLTAIGDATRDTEMGRERAMAFTAVEDAVMYAIAGLARHEPEPVEGEDLVHPPEVASPFDAQGEAEMAGEIDAEADTAGEDISDGEVQL